ncbi:hypothetical protein GOC74_12215 [Halomicrobium mukohataei]|uniref:Uncharacterized protein n=1 Tax=Halomicrobium mukohataei TaxID=57705 RepID=A0A847UC60_9EURY|nr:hypothetical protein [Halomicrobium mukohataei]NLV10689.1 hypothetical protein [Halomicrobium mukohataei]
MTRMIKTGRQDLYIKYVERAEAARESDDEDDEPSDEASQDSDYFFEYQYELFSFAATLGFLHDEKVSEDASYGQDIRRVEQINEDNPHREAIDFVTNVVKAAERVDEDDAWEEVLRYADAGVEIFDAETDDELDFVRFVQDASDDRWQQRLEETIGTPSDVGSL